MKRLFTSEMVCIGHPDKLCDYIADSILDSYMENDKNSRVAVEVCASYKRVLIMGEVTSSYKCDIEAVCRRAIKEVGYDNDELGFNGDNIDIIVDINKQSNDIAMGVDGDEIGAGDQGIIFGYATNETSEYLPYNYVLARNLAKRVLEVRNNNIIDYLRCDGKMQVTLEYDDDRLVRVHTIVISLQHKDGIDIDRLRSDVYKYIIKEVIPSELLKDTNILINPTGRFVIGGPVGDTGLTGRKIIVDTYGGSSYHGGGAFSGKDYTKVDRTAAYYARYVCKNLVAANLCDRCMLGVSYAIGCSKEISLSIDTFNTNKIDEDKILCIVNQIFDFSPSNMIDELDMKNICYRELTNFGHFGRENSTFEKLDKVDKIKELLSKIIVD